MDIRQGLENLQWHSEAARHLLTGIIDKLDELDGMDLITPSTKEENDELINRKDNATVDLYNRLQGFLNLLEWHRKELDKLHSIEKKLKLKLIQNDTDSDEVIKRSVKIYGSIFSETYYPETWDKEDYIAKTHSLTADLKNRISNRLMRENEIPEFKERMVDYGANKDLISNEPMTRQRADRIAGNLVYWIDFYLRNICRCQKNIADILDEGYSLMYPQPDTSIEQEQTVKQSSILEDVEVKAVMQDVEGIGLMVYNNGWYYWTGDNALLSYLCSEISRYKEYSKQMRGDEYLPNWIKFERIFKARGKRKDEWVEVDSNKLANYKKQYKKCYKGFSPDGCKDIDEIIQRCIKI